MGLQVRRHISVLLWPRTIVFEPCLLRSGETSATAEMVTGAKARHQDVWTVPLD